LLLVNTSHSGPTIYMDIFRQTTEKNAFLEEKVYWDFRTLVFSLNISFPGHDSYSVLFS
jgi:hypothetical protein